MPLVFPIRFALKLSKSFLLKSNYSGCGFLINDIDFILKNSKRGFPLTTNILNEFESITHQLQQPIQALGTLKPKRDVKDSFLKTLLSSFFGKSASNLVKDKSRYVAIDDTGAHLLIFKDEALDSKTTYEWSAIKDVSTSIDEQFATINFGHGEEKISWEIMRYQMVEPDGSFLNDTDLMKKVGEMTANIEARFKANA